MTKTIQLELIKFLIHKFRFITVVIKYIVTVSPQGESNKLVKREYPYVPQFWVQMLNTFKILHSQETEIR